MSEEADLLTELATLDEVEAWIPTNRDHVAEAVPSWCELVLEIKRMAEPGPAGKGGGPGEWPLNARMPLRRHDGELLIEVLHSVLHPAPGLLPAEVLWRDLDACMDRLMSPKNMGKPMNKTKGEATGLTRAIALITHPYGEPDIDEVRAVAMERWEIRHGVESSGEDD